MALLGGGVIGGAAVATLSRPEGIQQVFTTFAIGAIFGLVIALFAVAEWAGSRLYRLRRRVPLPPESISTHAARWFGGPPWTLARQQSGELVYWRQLGPNFFTALVLLVIGVVPGLLYLFFARGTQTIAIGIVPTATGSDLEILIQPQGHDGRRAVNRFFNSLHDLG